MKQKILDVLNEYKKEFIKYYKNVKIKLRVFFKQIKKYFRKAKENILRPENRKKYLTATGILIILNLLLVNLFMSYAYYNDVATFSLIHAKVGDMYSAQYDYVLLVYLEDTDTSGNGNGEYYLTQNIPALGYNYSGYKCQNDSTLIYDDETKTTSVTTDHKDICSVYFDVVGSIDLTVKIMLEDEVGSDTYTVSEQIPAYGYKYSYYECSNNGTLEYDSELHKVTLSSSTKEYCNMYFTKETSDITVNLFVEETSASGDYIERTSIPSNIIYTLNENKSSCQNNNGERLDASLTYTDGYIEIAVSEIASCDVYLDINNE